MGRAVKVIIAGNLRQAEEYAIEHGLERHEWVCPLRESELLGLHVSEVVYTGTWATGPRAARIADVAEHAARRNLTTLGQVEDTSHMTSIDEHMPLYLVNADPADAGVGHAIIGLVIAAAHKPSRTHLHGSVESFQYDAERGIGILVKDAGARQHLANALGLPRAVDESRITSPVPGMGYFRRGVIEGIKVQIWNFEE